MKVGICIFQREMKNLRHVEVTSFFTIVVGQGWRKIILKVDVKILWKLLFQRAKKLYGEKKILAKILFLASIKP